MECDRTVANTEPELQHSATRSACTNPPPDPRRRLCPLHSRRREAGAEVGCAPAGQLPVPLFQSLALLSRSCSFSPLPLAILPLPLPLPPSSLSSSPSPVSAYPSSSPSLSVSLCTLTPTWCSVSLICRPYRHHPTDYKGPMMWAKKEGFESQFCRTLTI